MFLTIIRNMEGKGSGATKFTMLPKALLNNFSSQNTSEKVKHNFKNNKSWQHSASTRVAFTGFYNHENMWAKMAVLHH